MSFNCCSTFKPNIISDMDDFEGLRRRTDAPNELSCNMVRASKEILVQEAQIMDARTQALEFRHSEEADNVDVDIQVED